MTLTVLDRPPAQRAKPPRTPVRGPVQPRPRDPRWLLPAAILVSVVAHLLAFLVFRFSVPVYQVPPSAVRAQRMLQIQPGMQVVQVVPTSGPVEPEAARETPEQPPEREPARAENPPAVAQPPAATPPARTETRTADPGLLDRLRPRADDPRLWAPPPPPAERPDLVAEALAPLYATLDAYNDSMAAAAGRAAKATDWTTTDENGNRWGISPGKIHLGKITLPLPFGFAPPPGRRDEIAGRVRSWNEIQRQAAEAAARENFDDRAKAIRERKAAEKRDTTSTRVPG